MNTHVIQAVFRRNFIAYFTNPTGYVFICVFVLLSSFCAFWPNDFFVANLANLDPLNSKLPLILLVFIPAITMSIWADERRQGTDELLLTMPATDSDVVVGKYLAAVAIYTASLVFSLFCNWIVLRLLGSPDTGLFLATYFGHWLVGLAMLAIGMTASFLTGNLTIGFVLGVLFNVPLVALAFTDTVIVNTSWGAAIAEWSVAEQFRDFGRGVVSLASLTYFLAIVVSMLYVSMVLIGRRHWAGGGGEEGERLAHYGTRTVSLLIAAVGLVMIAQQLGSRIDLSTEQLSSLSPKTRELIRKLDPKQPVLIDAYISREVPEAYVQTRLNLLSALREFNALGGGKVTVQVHDCEPNSEQADQAEKLYGIPARRVEGKSAGAYKLDEIYLGVAFMSGLKKVVVPFFDTGIPVEYEVARSIATVCRDSRRKLGVLKTDAQLFAGFDQATMSATRNQLLIDELEKQYDVKQVAADQPITEKFDVLLAVQPSSLAPEAMDNFVAAVKSGTPTAIFEDPFPYLAPAVTATSAPKQAPSGPMSMFQQMPNLPKGDINKLWALIGATMSADQIVYQRYNPHPRFELPPEFLFIDQGASDKQVFNQDNDVTSGLQELMLVFAGSFNPLNSTGTKFVPLVQTGPNTGYVTYGDTLQRNFMGQATGLNNQRKRRPTRDYYTLAAQITGSPTNVEVPKVDDIKKGKLPDEKKVETGPPINVIVVADIDLMFSEFFDMRARSNDPNRAETNFNFDNVTFVLNTIDALAGDADFVDIRKRRPVHRTLTTIDKLTEKSRVEAYKTIEELIEQRNKSIDEFKEQQKKDIEKLKNRKDLTPTQLLQELQLIEENNRRRLEAKNARENKEFERKRADIERQLVLETRRVQTTYKAFAVILPPIPPLLIGLAVFFMRRAQEREGVSRNRLR